MGMSLEFSRGPYVATDPNDTGLRFTDILFGFALREVVLRLVVWRELSTAVRVHLVLAVLIILCSYIGFRNSQKRGKFDLRFFNLATLRFLTDQGMVFLYFWVALYVSTARSASGELSLPTATTLVKFDARILLAIFALYIVWDLLSHWMAASGQYRLNVHSEEHGMRGELDGGETSAQDGGVALSAPFYRTAITLGCLVGTAVVWLIVEVSDPTDGAAVAFMVLLLVIVVIYRFLKDSLVRSESARA